MITFLILAIIFIVLYIIFFYPFSASFKIYLNSLQNKGFVLVKIALFNVVCKMIEIKKGKIILTDKNGEQKELIIKIPSKFQEIFFVNLIKRFDFRKVFVIFKGGVKDNAFATSLLCGAVASSLSVLKIFLKNKFNVYINYKIDTNYKQDLLTLASDVNVKTSIFALLASLVVAFFKNLGGNYGKRKQSYSKYSS